MNTFTNSEIQKLAIPETYIGSLDTIMPKLKSANLKPLSVSQIMRERCTAYLEQRKCFYEILSQTGNLSKIPKKQHITLNDLIEIIREDPDAVSLENKAKITEEKINFWTKHSYSTSNNLRYLPNGKIAIVENSKEFINMTPNSSFFGNGFLVVENPENSETIRLFSQAEIEKYVMQKYYYQRCDYNNEFWLELVNRDKDLLEEYTSINCSIKPENKNMMRIWIADSRIRQSNKRTIEKNITLLSMPTSSLEADFYGNMQREDKRVICFYDDKNKIL